MSIKQLKFVKSNGKSALGIHEYIARLGENRDNADKCLVQGYEHLPEFARDNPLLFWQMTDEHERANAKACTHVVVALPRELNVEAQTRMVEDFVQRNFKGCPLSWAIHEGKDQHNPHAHLQICERRIETEREARFSEKRFFKRNGVKKDRTLNERKFCSHLYRQYAGSINHHLQKVGSEARISVEARNYAFEEMSLSEKMQKNFDQELAELEKKQAKEMAELLKNLNKEEKETQGEKNDELSRREQNLKGTERGDTQEAGKSGGELESTGERPLSGGSNKSAGRGQERSPGSEEYFEGLSGDNDSGSGGMEAGTGSGENAKSDQESPTIGARLLELARTAQKALFRNKWLQKF
ncbi:MAG: MobA/MobL family protein [Lentisphaeraceae bacterium]|nr:MobA/MobL family protein [Lentisphaeraceae bacterium]